MFGSKSRKRLRAAQTQQLRDDRMIKVLNGELPPVSVAERLALRKKNKESPSPPTAG